MKDKYINLIRVLMQADDWMPASVLAMRLDVSVRTIKSYISEINYYEDDLIVSSRKGYRLDKDLSRKFFEAENSSIPQTPQERVDFIIKKVIMVKTGNGEEPVNLFELCESMFVSLETVKKDLIKVQKKFKEFDLFIHTSNFCIYLEGKELDKRKLLSNILYEEYSRSVLGVVVIQKTFPDYDLGLLRKIIMEKSKEYYYFINEYSVLKLVLDIIISMDRIKKGFIFKTAVKDIGGRELEFAREIAKEIKNIYGIEYPANELKELAILLDSYMLYLDYRKIDENNIEEVVGVDCAEIGRELLQTLEDYNILNTRDSEFIVKFMLHIKNLLLRIKNGYYIKNPLIDQIKLSSPLTFDCAVSIAHKLKEVTNYKITEDEIAYIALHIGSILESQKDMSNKVSCVMVFPQYYDFASKLLGKITELFGENMVIKAIVSFVENLQEIDDIDLIISTIPVPEYLKSDIAVVSPFLTDKDELEIRDKLRRIKLKKKKERLKEHLMHISNPKFFCHNRDFNDETEALNFMTGLMEEEGYVGESFVSEVFERERSSSTAFNHIAIPHSMKMNSKRTGMFVLLNEKSFLWGENMVNIVLLFAINPDERAIFHDIFDNLIVLLLEKANVNKLLDCENYEEFIDEIIGLIEL